MTHLSLITIIVDDYDDAIRFFVDALGFDLVEDMPATSSATGEPKRWVVVKPPDGATGILLARADGDDQRSALGRQAAGRVGFFLNVDDFDATYDRMIAAGVEFLERPRSEPYGTVVVFEDLSGNKWDLVGPA